MYPKVSGLAAWSENCFAVITLCVASQRVFIVVYFLLLTQSGNFGQALY
jgi:hypothetical protein